MKTCNKLHKVCNVNYICQSHICNCNLGELLTLVSTTLYPIEIMKRLLFVTLLLVSIVGINYSVYSANSLPTKKNDITVKEAERAKVLNERLIEIKEMDKSTLTAVERRELRKEVRAIKEELAQISGGVYLSIGAIIIILLLLILLL